MRRNPHSGFTLIEMLVVIAIISVLAAIVLFSVEEARKSSRDKQRKIDLKNMQLAVELYKEANDSYPLSCNGVQTSNRSWGGAVTGPNACPSSSDDMIQGVVPNFISVLPKDPKEEGQKAYLYASDGKTYKIMALQTLEKLRITSRNEEWARCPASCYGTGLSHPRCQEAGNFFYQTIAVYGGNDDARVANGNRNANSIMCY